MSLNRIKCKCCEIPTVPCLYNGEESECPEIMKVNVTVPATDVHVGKCCSADNCCAFASLQWSHEVKMYGGACLPNCLWTSPLETPHCVDDSHCAFPFDSLEPDVNCYNPSNIWEGTDCSSNVEHDTVCDECFTHGRNTYDCNCTDTAGSPCLSDGICSYGREDTYLRYTVTEFGITYCYFCGCCEDGHTNICFQHPECDVCQTCCHCSNCGDKAQGASYMGAMQTQIAASMSWLGGNINRFELSIGVDAKKDYIAQTCDCEGTWGAMIGGSTSGGNGYDWCCDNPSGLNAAPSWSSNGERNHQCGTDVGDCMCQGSIACGMGEVNIESWYMPEGITPANCGELIGVNNTTSGVQQSRFYTKWTTDTSSCTYDALGVTYGRNYIGFAKDFSPDWQITL